MASVGYKSLAGEILAKVGGSDNIATAGHCATRLRLKLKDDKLADKDAIEALPGVITVMQAGGQYQVVIGNNVPIVYQELTHIAHIDESAAAEAPKGNLLSRFIELITGIIHPILWTLAGAGLFKAFLALAATFGWLHADSSTYTILNAASDALFYFLPILLAVSAAKHFKTNQFTSMAIAGALVYPAITALAASTDVTFFGIPVVMANYTSSLIPIIVAVWLQSYLEKFLLKVLPSAIRNFMTPLLVLFIMVPLVLLTVGPVTTYLANGISSGIAYLFSVAPWLAGALMGGFWQVFVIFGLHWAFVPIMINDLTSIGYTLLGGPLPAAVLAQAAAMLAVMLRTRSKKLKQVAGPAALSGFLAGVTEPGIYGVNLPKRTPFIFGCIGGAVGGAIAAVGGSANNVFVFPSLIGLPGYMAVGSFTLQLIGTGLAIAIAFTLTMVFGFPDAADDEAVAPADATPVVGGTAGVLAPVAGRTVALADVPDKVFASEAMGKGVAIVPSSGTVHAPVSGTVIAAMDSGHAYGIKSNDGVEVLVHIGIDTVQLGGKGFTPRVAQGQQVKQGDVLAEVDLDAIAAAGYDATTIVVITNTASLTAIDPVIGADLATSDVAIKIEL